MPDSEWVLVDFLFTSTVAVGADSDVVCVMHDA